MYNLIVVEARTPDPAWAKLAFPTSSLLHESCVLGSIAYVVKPEAAAVVTEPNLNGIVDKLALPFGFLRVYPLRMSEGLASWTAGDRLGSTNASVDADEKCVLLGALDSFW